MFHHPKDPTILLTAEEYKKAMEKDKYSESSISYTFPLEFVQDVQARGLYSTLEDCAFDRIAPGQSVEEFINSMESFFADKNLKNAFMNYVLQEEDDNVHPVWQLYFFLRKTFAPRGKFPDTLPPGEWHSKTLKCLAEKQNVDNVGIFLEQSVISCLFSFIEIKVINLLNDGKRQLEKEIRNQIAEIPKGQNDILFYRTSAWDKAIFDIEQRLTNISKLDVLFELGLGAYLTPDLEYVLHWMRKYQADEGLGASLLVFCVPSDILSKMEGYVEWDEENWRKMMISSLKHRRFPVGPGYIFTYCCAETQKVAKCQEPRVLQIAGRKMRQLLLKDREALQFCRAARVYLMNAENLVEKK